MKLGGSLERRRWGRRRRRAEEAEPPEGWLGRWTHGPRFGAAIVSLGVAGWGLGYLVATQIAFPAPPPPGDLFEVPDLRGVALDRATEALQRVGLGLGTVDSLNHPTAEEQSVLGQAPAPGQLAPPGSPVRVTVSAGPQRRSIPDVRGLSPDRARIILETSGFTIRIDSAHADVPAGTVVEVSPPPERVLALPAEVDLVISLGPPLVEMPSVLGMRRQDAIRLLEARGLVVAEVTEVFRFGRDRGIVVGQVPSEGTELQRGDEVRLNVGREDAPKGTMTPASRRFPADRAPSENSPITRDRPTR